MMRRTSALIAVIGLLTLGACGSDGATDDATATTRESGASTTVDDTVEADDPGTTTTAASVSRTLTESDAGTTVAVRKGERFEVSLEWCPGCGYHWQPQATDGRVVTLEGSRDEQPQQPADGPPVVGGSGRQVFTYAVVGAGTAKVELGYIPPGRDAPEDTWSVTITAT